METCKHLLDAFERQLARQKELKALRAQQQQQHPVQVIMDLNSPGLKTKFQATVLLKISLEILMTQRFIHAYLSYVLKGLAQKLVGQCRQSA